MYCAAAPAMQAIIKTYCIARRLNKCVLEPTLFFVIETTAPGYLDTHTHTDANIIYIYDTPCEFRQVSEFSLVLLSNKKM